tara:strand:- start:625 stop:1203 length:579 start_codon:yes stop_codon:yes gene_type:complete
MPINHSKKLIFIHVPKNTGTSIKESCHWDHMDAHHTWQYYASNYQKEWKEYTSFALIRDPIDRFISCYRYARIEKSKWHDASNATKHPEYKLCSLLDIDTFLEILLSGSIHLRHQAWAPQSYWIAKNGVCKVKRVINYKNLDSELQSLGLPNLPKLNVSKGTNDVCISERSKKLIKLIYSVDYKLLDSLKLK